MRVWGVSGRYFTCQPVRGEVGAGKKCDGKGEQATAEKWIQDTGEEQTPA